MIKIIENRNENFDKNMKKYYNLLLLKRNYIEKRLWNAQGIY